VQKLKSTPRAFTLGVKAEIEKKNSICPKLLINAKLYGLVLAPRIKKPKVLECRVNRLVTEEHRPITEHPYSAGVGLCWFKKTLMGVVTLAYR
jgi:hypothetical protein